MTDEYYWEPQPVSPDFVIAQLNFLGDIPTEELLEIFEKSAQQLTIPMRGVLFEQDTPIDKLYIILTGRFWQSRIETDQQGNSTRRLEREVGPGIILGVQDFLFGDQYRTKAQALETSTVLTIETSALNRLLFHHPDVRERLAPLGLIDRMRTIPLVGRLDEVTLGFLATVAEEIEILHGEIVYPAGQMLALIYLIDRGQIVLDWSDGRDNWLGNGAAFGMQEGAQIAPGARLMDHKATATGRTKLIVIPHADFVAITGRTPDAIAMDEIREREHLLENLLIFSELDQQYDHHMAGFISHYYFPYSHVVIQQGEEADSMWILMPGSKAILHANDANGNKLLPTSCEGPTYFAETALLGLISQDSTIEAMIGSEWLRLHWRDFERLSRFEKADLRSDLVVDAEGRHSVADRQQRTKYEWLQPGERLIVLSRRHWIAYLRKGIPGFVGFLVLLGLGFLGLRLPGFQLWISIPFFFLSIISLGLFVWGTVDYFNDWIVVTNRRVVHQEKVLFVNEWRKEAPLEHVQNVDFQTNFIGNWLNYGTMIIQTASTSGVIEFNYTTNFDELRSTIYAQREQRRRHSAAESKLSIHRMLEARLGQAMVLPSQVLRGEQVAAAGASWSERKADGVLLPAESDDRIVWRKHWMVLLPKLWLPLLVLGFWLFEAIFPFVTSWLDDLPALRTTLIVIGIISSLIALARVAWVIANWHNDTYEVTDDELAHVEKLPFSLVETRRSAGLGRLQNVEMRITSPIEWFFNYGNVICQTAAEDGAFVFESVPDPRAVADEIQTRMERYRRREETDAAQKRAQELPDWFEVYRTLDREAA